MSKHKHKKMASALVHERSGFVAEGTTVNVSAEQAGSGVMFDGIAPRYDLLNRLLSFGCDKRWRRKTVEALRLTPELQLLDVAVGTGDLALDAVKAESSLQIVGLDPSQNMMRHGQQKVVKQGCASQLAFVQGDAEALPFADHSFDRLTIAFGIRNVKQREVALKEMVRVIKPDGLIAILELSEPKRGFTGRFAQFYIQRFVPWMGGTLSKSKAYRYLQQSIVAFPEAEQFSQMMEHAGMEVLKVQPFTWGVCVLFLGRPRCQQP